MRFSDLRNESFARRRLEGTSLAGAVLAGVDFRGAELIVVDLRGCDLEGADLRGALLVNCDLSQADLARARLRRATLVDVRAEGASARDASCDDLLAYPQLPACLQAARRAPRATSEREATREAVLALGRGLRALELDDDVDAARRHTEEAAMMAPDWSRAARALGDVELRAGRTALAEAAYRRAMRLDGTDLRAARSLAHCLSRSGELAEAESLLRPICAALPDDTALLRELAWVLAQAGALAEAHGLLRRAEAISASGREPEPDLVGLQLQLAAVETSAGRLQSALDRFRKLLARFPEHPEALRAFAEFCERALDAPEPTADACARYLEHHAPLLEVCLRQARAQAALGDGEGALAALRAARRLDGTEAARAARQALEAQMPAWLDASLRFEELFDATAQVDDARTGVLCTRAAVALDRDAHGHTLRCLVRTDLDEEQRTELALRRALLDRSAPRPTVDETPDPALGHGIDTHRALDQATARLLGLAKTADLTIGPAAPLGATFTAYGSLLVLVDEPNGSTWLEFLFGEGQRRRCSVGAAVHSAPMEGARAARALRPPNDDTPIYCARRGLCEPPPEPTPIAMTAAERATAREAALDGLPGPLRARCDSVLRALEHRLAQQPFVVEEAVVEGETAPISLVAPPQLSVAGDEPWTFTGDLQRGPAWLASLMALLSRDRDRSVFSRFGALLPEERAIAALPPLPTPLLEGAAAHWLLGPALADVALMAGAESVFGEAARGLRFIALDALCFRAELVARGILRAWLDVHR